jgi:hypothetical protein
LIRVRTETVSPIFPGSSAYFHSAGMQYIQGAGLVRVETNRFANRIAPFLSVL